MPAKSAKQWRYMAGVMSGNIKATGGLTPAKAKEFVDSTPQSLRKQYSKKKK
jgi:hypothetical protein